MWSGSHGQLVFTLLSADWTSFHFCDLNCDHDVGLSELGFCSSRETLGAAWDRTHCQLDFFELLSKMGVMAASLASHWGQDLCGLLSEPSISHADMQVRWIFTLVLCSSFFKGQTLASSSFYVVHRSYHVPDTLQEAERIRREIWTWLSPQGTYTLRARQTCIQVTIMQGKVE